MLLMCLFGDLRRLLLFCDKKDQEAKRPILRIALPCGSFGQRELFSARPDFRTVRNPYAKDYCQGEATFFFGKVGSMSQWLIVDYVWCLLCLGMFGKLMIRYLMVGVSLSQI